jgi:long-chain acyl-CoA synthetase
MCVGPGMPRAAEQKRKQRQTLIQDARSPPGEPGEILLRSPAVMTGYWNRTGQTINALQGGWIRTGYIGYLDEDGFLFVVDRKKDIIVSSGENIYSREVEEAL